MPEWDEENRPKDYIISVTPGFSQYGQGKEKLINMGLARKLSKAARLGFEFAEIDFEALSEMYEPEIKKQVHRVKNSQGLEVGLHLPVSMDLCLASSYHWKQMHEQLVKGSIAGAEKMTAKFVLFHTSSRQRPAVISELGPREMPSKLAAFNGKNLGEFIDEQGGDFKDWFMAKFISVLFRSMGVAGDPGMITYYDRKVVEEGKGFKRATKEAKEGWVKILNKHEDEIKKEMEKEVRKNARQDVDNMSQNEIREMKINIAQQRGLIPSRPTREQVEKALKQISIADVIEKRKDVRWERNEYHRNLEDLMQRTFVARDSAEVILKKKDAPENYFDNMWLKYQALQGVERYTDQYNFYEIFEYWTRHGSEGDESAAYHVIAKWMYKNGDDLWKSIVDTDMDPDQIVFEAEVADERDHPKEKLVKWTKQLITSVAAKYIEGHLTTSGEKIGAGHEIGVPINNKGEYTDPSSSDFEKMMPVLDYLKKHKVHVFIETNMPGDYGGGQGAPPGELRIIKATDHVKICKAIDPGHISYCMDFEHLLTNYVDPIQEAKELKKNQDGKHIRCLHINAPRPVKGAHAPIQPMSHDMYIIYSYIYTLREAGVKNAYWIWEMGSHGVEESAIAFRKMRKYLIKDVDPEKLPPEFFGIDKKFESRQMNTIKDHFADPLEGLLHEPEEAHSFLSKGAVDKGKAAEYQRERYQ